MPTIFKKGRIRGFTLIELLVVVAILAILAVVGFVVFRNVSQNARDSRSKGDINAIAKAYEVNFQSTGVYQALINTNFASGNIPNHYCAVGPSSGCLITAADRYAICLPLGEQSEPCYTPSSTCFCRGSAQGGSFSGTGYGGGGGGAVCDPYGTLTSGLVGYWRFDQVNAGTTPDYTGHGLDLTLRGAVVPSLVPGKAGFGNALNLVAASSQYADRPDASSGPLGPLGPFNLGSPSMTISAWVYPNTLPTAGNVYAIVNKNGPYLFWLEGTSTNGRISAALYRDIYEYEYTNNSIGLGSASGWQHVVLTYNGTTNTADVDERRLYVNGALSGPFFSTFGNLDPFAAPFNIGRDHTGTGRYYFDGMIDDVRMYNRALSGPEVATLYNGGTGCLPN